MNETLRNTKILEKVVNSVCAYYGIAASRIFSRDRHKIVSDARNIIIYILHKDFKLSISFLSHEFSRSERWVVQLCAVKKQHIFLYKDCSDEYENLLKIIKD